jgi:leishmanolysin
VLKFARDHFGCNELEGVPLENGGGDGSANSHWEKLFLSNTYMNSVTEFPGYISSFTLKMLNDTGWYFVSFSIFPWGIDLSLFLGILEP